jgi:hypothetical protein
MPDDLRSNGLGAPGQRTSERTGGFDDIRLALYDTAWLLIRRCVEVVFLALYVPVIVGPPILVIYAPLTLTAGTRHLARWFTGEERDTDPWSLVAIGALALLALLMLPEAALRWWPFRWQVDRASWWWLRMHPAWLLVRAVLVVAPWRAWREVWYRDQRQRAEVITPTISGVAYTSPAPHTVEVPGVWNPYQPPQAPTPPADTRGDLVVRYVPAPELVDGADDSSRIEAVLPLSIIARQGEHEADTLRHAEALVDGMLFDGRASRAALMAYGLSDGGARTLQSWLSARDYAVDHGDGNGLVVTPLGRRWLRIVERHMPPF